MQSGIRLVHLYDTEGHRIACGAPGLSNSTKHARGVNCSACLALVVDARAAIRVAELGRGATANGSTRSQEAALAISASGGHRPLR